MKNNTKLSFVIGLILLTIQPNFSKNENFLFKNFALNEVTNFTNTKKEKPKSIKNNSLDWLNFNNIIKSTNLNESVSYVTYFNEQTITISNKKIATSTDDSFQDNKGNNSSKKYESGNIRFKGFRFTNLNIPANAIITNVKLTLTGYKHGKTTVTVKAENLKAPVTYRDDKNYLSSRNNTNKSVSWYIPQLSNGVQLVSPNLKDIVQEIVNGKDGITHLSLIISSSKKWEGWNYDDRSSSYYPKIDISYTLAVPIANDDGITIDENTKATVKIFDNDKNIPSNVNFWVNKTPKNGSVSPKDPNNTPNDKSDDILEYTPNNNFDGADTFEYTVCDNKNNCDKATVKITINSVVDPCDAVASGNLDTDKDGIADVCDLDDDNDGILDVDECPQVNPFTFKLNANNKTFTDSGESGDIGDIMLYKRVGTNNGTNIDLKITVTANSDPENMTIDISGFKFGSDLYPVLLGGENKKDIPYASVKFEFIKSGTNELINVAPSFMFKDVDLLSDGSGESVEINKNLVSSYALSNNPNTNLYIVDNVKENYSGTNGDFLRINSKTEGSGLDNESLWIALQMLEVNSFNINFLKRNGNTGYVFESDNFSKNGNTIQLDSDCSLDTDSDGIPDYLDTDSDNDGCPDATEASRKLTTTNVLDGGSNGGSSANLGTVSNKNGIPLPIGTANGNQTNGQNITVGTKVAEKLTVNTTVFNITGNVNSSSNIEIDVNATTTNTFNNGVPNYDNPNGTDTSSLITYKWYKETNPGNTLSTSKTLTLNNLNVNKSGDYIVIIKGANSSCTEEITYTLTVNDTPNANKDYGNAQEDSVNNSINVLNNDSFGNDGANTGKITLVSEKSDNNGTITVNDNNTPNDPTDDKLLYSPFPNFNGRDTFKYTITDANGDASTTEVSIFVNSVNDIPNANTDTFSVNENSNTTTFNVTENDNFGGDGPNEGKIVVYNRTSKEKGSVNVDDNGTPKDPTDDKISYKPAEDFDGTDEFTYVIIDSNGSRSTAKVIVNVISINDTPTAVADEITLEEDSSNTSINILENDDFGNDGASSSAITLVNTTSEKGGTVSVNTNETPNNPVDDNIIYTPLADFNGLDSFEYVITDADGETSTAKVTITVTAVNDLPSAVDDTITLDEDSTNNNIDVLVNDSFGGDGANTGTITISSATSAKGGSISINNNSTANDPTDDKITYTPSSNYFGSDSFEYTITDANGDTSTGKVNITVSSVNDLPTAEDDTITVDEDSTNNTINFFANDSFGGDGYVSGNTTTFSEPNNGGSISINNNNTPNDLTDDTFTYAPSENFNGVEAFTYTIKDANGDEATGNITVTVTSVNDTPTATNDTAAALESSTNNSISVTENDDFGGDGASSGAISLTSGTTSQNGTVIVDDNSTPNNPTDDKILYTPLGFFNGVDTFSYTITDSNGDTSSATATINVASVNNLPTATDDSLTVNEDSSENTLLVLSNDNFGGDGANSSKITITSTTTNKNGTISVDDNSTETDPTDDKITYTPLENFNGTDTFTYSITDSNGDVSSATVTVTVASVNDLPSATNDAVTVEEDSTNNSFIVLDNDSFGGDGSNNSTITLVNSTTSNGGTLTVSNNDTPSDPTDDSISYSPKENFNGTDAFDYTITDANGDTSTATVTITVTSVNDTPNAKGDAITLDEDSTNTTINVLDNDNFGGDGEKALTISTTTTTRGGKISINDNSTPNNPLDDSIIYTPRENFNGKDYFAYKIEDADGDISTGTVTVTVNSINDLPTVGDDSITVDEDSSRNRIEVLTNDSYGGDGYLTRARTLIDLTGTKGRATANNNGTRNDPTDDVILYTPPANFNGTDTFKYTIIDASGDRATANVTVTVTSVNDTPATTDDDVTFNEDSMNNIINVTINDDFGGDGAKPGTISITSTSTSESGTISIDNNETETDPTDDKIIYTPVANFNGTDTFNYTITDIDGDTSEGKVTITVNSVNDVPVAITDAYTIDEDSTNNTFDVLDNDNFGGDGASATSITVASENSEKGGSVTVNDNGTETDPTDDKITYSPLANFNGADTFSYTISDANGDTSTITVYVSVNSVNDLPIATNDAITVDEDSSSNTIDILTNDSFGGDGANSGKVTLPKGTSTEGGTVSINQNNTEDNPTDDTLEYTPAANFNGTDTFEYTITDANGDTSKATVTITVTSINDTPQVTNDVVSVNEDSTNNTINVLDNDTFGGDGAASEVITINAATSSKGGTISVDNNNTINDPTDDKIVYTPLTNFNGIDSFEYTIKDADGETSTATVTINVDATGIQYNPLSITECFNIFVQNNLSLANGKTTGNVALGGNLTFDGNYEIASSDCGCFEVNDIKIGLLVGKKVNYPQTGILKISNENNYLKIGEDGTSTIWYQDPAKSDSPIRVTPAADFNANSYIETTGTSEELGVSNSVNPINVNNVLDFESAFQQLRAGALSMSKELNSTTLLNSDLEEISNTNLPSSLTINLENSVNYLNITGEELNNVSTLDFYEKPSANKLLIINVNAENTFNWNVYEQTNIDSEDAPFVIYNFYNTTNLNIQGSNSIFGSISAPFAEIVKTDNTENVYGQIIGKSLTLDGGNIECAVFDSSIFSPIDDEVAPITDFSINIDDQCLIGNTFEFTNTTNTGSAAQPTKAISYAWDFGDGTTSSLMTPTKTYDEAGTYTVKLTATNDYGSSEKSETITVQAIIVADVEETNSTIDEDAGTVTKEYTLNNDTEFTSFTWSITDFDTSSFYNQKTVSFEFKEEGEYELIISTVNNNCNNTVIVPITITSDEVSTGNDGGLESESLGGALSKRYMQRKINSVPTIFKKSKDIIYNKSKMLRKQVKKSNDLTMLEMFPDEVIVGDIAHVTSPTDILDFTVADEVLSVDFSLDDKTIGVVLGVKTIDQIYNHTKATCDRLRGAEILTVKTVEIEGYNFLQQAIQQRDGVIEHAISFAVSKNKDDESYNLQTNWYVFDYIAANDVFNFQVWASEPVNTQKMVKDILANLNNYKVVEQPEKQKTPRSFATKIRREQGQLKMDLKSFEETEDLEIAMTEKTSETVTDLNTKYAALNSKKEQTFELKVDDGYEYDGDIIFDGEVQDAFYHADGNWGLDYDQRYTTVNKYEVSNNTDRKYNDDEMPINRNVEVKAYSEFDYLSVFKALLPGNLSADYTAYNYLSFKAKGKGPTQLVLVKSGIENWGEQYRATVNLTDEEQTFYIPFESFTSTASTDKIVADDLTTISFVYIAVDAGTNDLEMKISDVKFSKTNTALSVDEFISPKKNEFFVYPNPSLGNVNCTIFSDVTTKATATLYDITGKTIYKGELDLTTGKNELKFNFKPKAGVMFLKINSSQINYGTSKIVFK